MEIKVLASGSSGNAYLISDKTSSLLLDAGIPIKQLRILSNFRLSSVAGALITHRHGDHSKAVPELLSAGIKVYALDDVFKATGTQGVFGAREIHPEAELSRVFTVGSFVVTPFSVHHDVPTTGFYIHSRATKENLVYFTDTFYISYSFPKLNYLLCECNYDPEVLNENVSSGRLPPEFKSRLVKSHMSIDTLLDLLRANDLSQIKQIYLLHLSNTNGLEDDFQKRVQALTGCEVYIC